MPFISATRLRVRSLLYLPGFMIANEASVKRLPKIPGFIAGKELVDKSLVFWTITVWEDGAAMKLFRNCEPHRKAMQNLPRWCNEASYIHWVQDSTEMPGWITVHEKMLAEGNLTKVRHLSVQQLSKAWPPVRWHRLQGRLKK